MSGAFDILFTVIAVDTNAVTVSCTYAVVEYQLRGNAANIALTR